MRIFALLLVCQNTSLCVQTQLYLFFKSRLLWWALPSKSEPDAAYSKPVALPAPQTKLPLFFFTGTGRTNTCHPSGWAQVFSCIPLLLPYVKRSTCTDSGPLGSTPTRGRTSHTTTMIRREQSSRPSGRSPTSCLQSSSCSTGCTVKDWPNSPCRIVPKNLNLEVPNDCLKSAQNRIKHPSDIILKKKKKNPTLKYFP